MTPSEARTMVQDGTNKTPSSRRTKGQSRRGKSSRGSESRKGSEASDLPSTNKPADLEALRKARLERLSEATKERPQKVRYVGESTTKVAVKTTPEDEPALRSHSPVKKQRKTRDGKHQRRHAKSSRADSEAGKYQNVYDQSAKEQSTLTGRQQRRSRDAGNDEQEDRQPETSPSDITEEEEEEAQEGSGQKLRVEKVRRHVEDTQLRHHSHQKSSRRKGDPVQRTQRSASNPHHRKRSINLVRSECANDSIVDMPNKNTTATPTRGTPKPRPSLTRSATNTSSRLEHMLSGSVISMARETKSVGAESHGRKSSSLFSSLLRSSTNNPATIKKVACLTCGADDVPAHKTAKLACSHRMCHECLRRIFTMSATDPAHMPPKCCTSEHIPLKHVDHLFDQKFKKTWNRKFQEYSTRNRIYCPNRHCGLWIKPHYISLENGRKVAKCKKCGTRVCCLCNLKMHASQECPRDPATKLFVEVAKKEGWKRCFNCAAMVELKEGCNHMTCRCKAEFCMACGRKWKTCDCPWFNYETVEADRLEHMNVLIREGRIEEVVHRRGDVRRQEEADRRRRQERRDEALARRLQNLGENDGLVDDPGGNNEEFGQVFGVGNAAHHFLNDHFRHRARNDPAGNFGDTSGARPTQADGNAAGPAAPVDRGQQRIEAWRHGVPSGQAIIPS